MGIFQTNEPKSLKISQYTNNCCQIFLFENFQAIKIREKGVYWAFKIQFGGASQFLQDCVGGVYLCNAKYLSKIKQRLEIEFETMGISKNGDRSVFKERGHHFKK